MTELMACRVLVSGRVQGVCYRASTQQQARTLDLSGWVRNLPDGRVEAWLEGSAENLNKMIAWMREGPVHARVDSLEQQPQTMAGHQGFEVTR